jgi:hypothetical protein
MAKIVEMDERITISAQWEENVGPVILINKFSVNSEDLDLFLKAWPMKPVNLRSSQGSSRSLSGSSFPSFMLIIC